MNKIKAKSETKQLFLTTVCFEVVKGISIALKTLDIINCVSFSNPIIRYASCS